MPALAPVQNSTGAPELAFLNALQFVVADGPVAVFEGDALLTCPVPQTALRPVTKPTTARITAPTIKNQATLFKAATTLPKPRSAAMIIKTTTVQSKFNICLLSKSNCYVKHREG